MTTRIRPDQESTRLRILEAATDLFQERGYDRTSMVAIAHRVGITAPALYWHFPSKEAIFFGFMESVLIDFVTGVENAVPEGPANERLRYFVRGHVLGQLRQLDVARAYGTFHGYGALLNSLPENQRARLIQLQRRHVDLLRAILRQGVADDIFEIEQITPASFAIINMCEYVITWFKPDGPLSMEDVATLYEELALRMVAPRLPVQEPPRRIARRASK